MTEELKKFAESERRKGYAELGEQLDAHADRLASRLHGFILKGTIAFAIIGLMTTLALIGFEVVLREQQHNSNQLKALVASNKRFVNDIQRQRRDSIIDSCTAQNKRHDGAVGALNKGAAHDIAHHKELGLRAGEIERRKAVTIALLDALQPVQDCNKLVRDSVQGG
jgi:hypothetical protein